MVLTTMQQHITKVAPNFVYKNIFWDHTGFYDHVGIYGHSSVKQTSYW